MMDDTMSKEKAADLLDNLVGMVSDTQGNDYDTALRMGADALNAERHGRWIYDRLITTTGGTYGVRRCSECDSYYQDVGYGFNYCPNCGARNDGEQHE